MFSVKVQTMNACFIALKKNVLEMDLLKLFFYITITCE